MDIKGFSSWTVSLIIVLIALSWPQTAHGAGGRMSNHFFFRFRKTTPTPSDREGSNNGAKLPGSNPPSSSPPSSPSTPGVYDARSFLKYLFEKGRLPSVKLNKGDVKQPTTTATTTTTTRRTRPTTTFPTSPLTTRTSRSVAAGAATPGLNTNNNEDGAAGTNRPNMLPFPGATLSPTDRQAKIRAFDLWLLTNFKRPPLLARNTDRPQPNNGDPNRIPFERSTATAGGAGQVSPVSAPPTTLPSGSQDKGRQNPGMVIQRGTVFIKYQNRQDQNRRTTEATDDVSDGAEGEVSTDIGDRHRGSTPQVQIYDKPFYGAQEEWFHEDHTTTTTTVASNTGEGTSATTNGRGSGRSARTISKRAAEQSAHLDPMCYEPYKFKPCEFYPSCFSKIDGACQPRESFIGDDVSRLCNTLLDTIDSSDSKLLQAYLGGVEQCLSKELYLVLEYPTCDDITQALIRGLLQRNHSNCLYQDGLFCKVINDDIARPALARMLFKPTDDVDFMMRFLVNVGRMTLYCNGPGTNIFLTDLMLLITDAQSPFQLPSTPKPWFEP